jgi:hypothetical protein
MHKRIHFHHEAVYLASRKMTLQELQLFEKCSNHGGVEQNCVEDEEVVEAIDLIVTPRALDYDMNEGENNNMSNKDVETVEASLSQVVTPGEEDV